MGIVAVWRRGSQLRELPGRREETRGAGIVLRSADIDESAGGPKCQRSDASDLWSHQVALERKRAPRPEACSQRRPQNIGPGIDPSGPRSSFLVKPSHRVVAQLESTVTRDVRHAANGQAQLRPRRRMRVEHCAEIKLEIGIAVQHEDIARPYVIACQAYRPARAQRFGFHRIAQGKASIVRAEVQPDRLMTIARREGYGLEARIGQLIEDERQEGAALHRSHRLWNVVHYATQARAEAACEDDRLH